MVTRDTAIDACGVHLLLGKRPVRLVSCMSQDIRAWAHPRDTGSFGSLQALPSWLRTFGVLNAKGAYVLPTERKSIMNSGKSGSQEHR